MVTTICIYGKRRQPVYYFRWSDISGVYATKRKTLSRVLALFSGIIHKIFERNVQTRLKFNHYSNIYAHNVVISIYFLIRV